MNSMETLIKNDNTGIICLQEIKINERILNEYEYHRYYNFAEKKGYNGTMIFIKDKLMLIKYEMGLDSFDREGKFILLEYDKFISINKYIFLMEVEKRKIIHINFQ